VATYCRPYRPACKIQDRKCEKGAVNPVEHAASPGMSSSCPSLAARLSIDSAEVSQWPNMPKRIDATARGSEQLVNRTTEAAEHSHPGQKAATLLRWFS